MEKMHRSYGGRPQYLTDVVRSTIICTNIQQVQNVLEVVMLNAEVHVIKNRFNLDYDGKETYGIVYFVLIITTTPPSY